MHHVALIVDNIRSTHNVGSLLRTAECLGVAHVYLCGTTPYPMHVEDERLPHLAHKTHDKIHKTALGAESLVSWRHFPRTSDAIADARTKGYRIVALEQDAQSTSLDAHQIQQSTALIVGPEVTGIDTQTLALCDNILEIPMKGKKESLNVSVAAAIAIYQLTR